jgi:hypothetical protein
MLFPIRVGEEPDIPDNIGIRISVFKAKGKEGEFHNEQ